MTEKTDNAIEKTRSSELSIPDLCLVILVGASGSGKSTFAAKHFLPTEILSSDKARGMVADDETDQSVTKEAFELLHYWAEKRLQLGKVTVIDATNVNKEDRRALVQLARRNDVLPVAIVIDTPVEICIERNEARTNRNFGDRVVKRHCTALRRSVRHLKKEGFRYSHHLKGVAAIDTAKIVRTKRWTDKRELNGPFDIFGDIHGCYSELAALLTNLGYTVDNKTFTATHPEGRTAVFVGDLVDRGPEVVETLTLVMNMVAHGSALCVIGNHENKLLRALNGRNVQRTHGLPESLDQLETTTEAFREKVAAFLKGLISHYILDDGKLVVCHAGLPEKYHNKSSGRVRSFAMYGETTGETDAFGFPERYEWAQDYRGSASVVYGHTPVSTATWVNNTICLDTGVVFGGELTALRWPEKTLATMTAFAEHYEPVKSLTSRSKNADVLDLADVTGKRFVETKLMGRVTVSEERNAAALEVMSRFTVDPRWLTYLPPTMAPVSTSNESDVLERPQEAFAYFKQQGIEEVVCQEKHMGSRCVAVVGRTSEALQKRFRIDGHSGAAGMFITRKGRQFFTDDALNSLAVAKLQDVLTACDAWERLESDWLMLDCELLPWSMKATDLLRNDFASVAAAGELWSNATAQVLQQAAKRNIAELDGVIARVMPKTESIDRFREAYRNYVWPTSSLEGVQLAPFVFLAGEGQVLARKSNRWHVEQCDQLNEVDSTFLRRTERRFVRLDDDKAQAEAIEWWTTMTAAGGEGMVVKPLDPVGKGLKGLIQPGVKVRGPDYLRIIYGPDYLLEENMSRLKGRNLGRKKSLALREFALGIEALDLLVSDGPLWQVHERVFSILALESEPVDPRL